MRTKTTRARTTASRAAFALEALACVALAACSTSHTSPTGGLVVVLQTDMSVPKDVDQVSLDVEHGGEQLLHVVQSIGAGQLLLPASFPIAATGDAVPLQIHAVAYKSGQPQVERDAVTPVPVGYVGELVLPLDYLCVGMVSGDGGSTCPSGETCVEGTCTSSTVPPGGVTPYTPDDAGTDAGAATCFDTLDCFASATPAPLDTSTCSVAAPASTGSLNVALQLAPGSQGICSATACWVPIPEGGGGWTLANGRVVLPPGVCTALTSGESFTIAVTTACPTEVPANEPCGPWTSQPPPQNTVGQACTGPTTQACGNCGTQLRTCDNGTWSAWSSCGSQGVCAPDASQACGDAGTQQCGGSCQWGACQACPGSTTQACGNCGTRTRTCTSAGWSDWSACSDEGVCTPNASQACGDQGSQSCASNCQWGSCSCAGAATAACGNCGTKTRTCNGGQWSGYGPCTGEGACIAGTTQVCGDNGAQTCDLATCQWDACTGQACSGDASQACGNCGTQGRTCTNGTWSAWSACTGESTVCTSGTTQACTVGDQPGAETCDTTTCVWDPCVACSGPAQQPCGNCGTESRTCGANSNWNDFGPCTGEGTCVAGTTQACTTAGYWQTCDLATCQWDACVTCSGPTQQPCGNCGTQSRTCTSGVWSAWGTCGTTGACVAGATQACGTGGTQTCDTTTCQWDGCTGQTCSGTSSRACGNCGTQTATCNNGTWVWGACTGQGACAPNATQGCGTAAGSETCSSTCQWGACSCVGATEQGCGNCNTGTQTRACNDGTWGAWGACTGQGCAPGAVQSCAGGSQGCTASCQWSSCCDPAPYTLVSGSVVQDTAGRQWQRTPTSGIVDYAGAVSTCQGLGGNWRLPTYAELETLAPNFTEINTCAFPIQFQCINAGSCGASVNSGNAYANIFWSSTQDPYGSETCTPTSEEYWEVNLYTGDPEWISCPEVVDSEVLCVQ